MANFRKAQINHPMIKANALGLLPSDYEAEMSTLCGGCGHDSISKAIILACYEANIAPHQVVKVSGIGCSSKTPGYYLRPAHGINSAHGRAPSIATGANIADKDLMYLLISGDGDSGSIGIGQFVHTIRRQLNVVYVCANNGIYGLTKGQFSATADLNAESKKGLINNFQPVDLAQLAIDLGASFVARSFSGDKTQLVSILKSAFAHKGFAFIDVLSPCVTFNNHKVADKGYKRIRKDNSHGYEVKDLVPEYGEIQTFGSGTSEVVKLHHGESLVIERNQETYRLSDREAASKRLREMNQEGKLLTGLIYLNSQVKDLHDNLNTADLPLRSMGFKELSLKKRDFAAINKSLSL